jgi:hypothetical protein
MKAVYKFFSKNATERLLSPEREALLTDFLSDHQPTRKSYENLFIYFIQGFETFRSKGGASAHYPGMPSRHGKIVDGLEGFSRVVPLIGAWVRSGRSSHVYLTDGRRLDLIEIFKRGLIAGTNPASPDYWGTIGDLDQRIVEASDIALSLWLLRENVWEKLAVAEKEHVIAWLKQVMDKKVHDNNWHLFVAFVGLVLEKLGHGTERSLVQKHYERFKEFYRGEGWFSDGPKGAFDFYNAYGMHYQLYWFQEVDPTWDSEFINTAQGQFLASYKYVLGPQGVPIFGRSVCYRMALPAPLVFGHISHPGHVNAGEARRALDVVWQFFIRHGALRHGNVTQGYYGPDPRILDNYSGPASCLWSIRSLIVAFYLPADSTFWNTSGEALPVEKEDYEIVIKTTGWKIRGKKQGNVIEIEHAHRAEDAGKPLKQYGFFRKTLGLILGKPFRPPNKDAKYRRRTYSSKQPFCGCLPNE